MQPKRTDDSDAIGCAVVALIVVAYFIYRATVKLAEVAGPFGAAAVWCFIAGIVLVLISRPVVVKLGLSLLAAAGLFAVAHASPWAALLLVILGGITGIIRKVSKEVANRRRRIATRLDQSLMELEHRYGQVIPAGLLERCRLALERRRYKEAEMLQRQALLAGKARSLMTDIQKSATKPFLEAAREVLDLFRWCWARGDYEGAYQKAQTLSRIWSAWLLSHDVYENRLSLANKYGKRGVLLLDDGRCLTAAEALVSSVSYALKALECAKEIGLRHLVEKARGTLTESRRGAKKALERVRKLLQGWMRRLVEHSSGRLVGALLAFFEKADVSTVRSVHTCQKYKETAYRIVTQLWLNEANVAKLEKGYESFCKRLDVQRARLTVKVSLRKVKSSLREAEKHLESGDVEQARKLLSQCENLLNDAFTEASKRELSQEKKEIAQVLRDVADRQRKAAELLAQQVGVEIVRKPVIEVRLEHIGGWSLEELIGEGGMAFVYRGKRKGRTAAVKVLKPTLALKERLREAFLREANTLLQLKHPNIVKVYEVGEEHNYIYIAMQYVTADDGKPRNLEQELHRVKRFDSKRTAEVIEQLCAALAYAHDQNIIHCDVKPTNVLLSRKGRVRLADFGLARAMRQQAPHSLLTTATGSSLKTAGTWAYM
ncbi:MAG: hypothetical protein DRP63_07025, partial [Planctomycetota bacterium]